MVVYRCDRCEKVFNKKIDYTRHKSRKFPCKKNTSLISTDSQETLSTLSDIYPHKNDSQIDLRVKSTTDKKEYTCSYCHSIFSKNSNMHRHIDRNCRAKYLKKIIIENNDKQKKQNQIFQEILQKMDEQVIGQKIEEMINDKIQKKIEIIQEENKKMKEQLQFLTN